MDQVPVGDRRRLLRRGRALHVGAGRALRAAARDRRASCRCTATSSSRSSDVLADDGVGGRRARRRLPRRDVEEAGRRDRRRWRRRCTPPAGQSVQRATRRRSWPRSCSRSWACPAARRRRPASRPTATCSRAWPALHELPRAACSSTAQLAKLKSTYVDTLPALVAAARRAPAHQLQPDGGRDRAAVVVSDPNLQNIPFRTPLGREVRRAFVARPGWQLLSADYSQIELRLMAHFSRDPALVEAFQRGEDVHARTARARLRARARDEAARPSSARMAKTVNFGVMYGMGARALAQQLGIPVAEAEPLHRRVLPHPRGRAKLPRRDGRRARARRATPRRSSAAAAACPRSRRARAAPAPTPSARRSTRRSRARPRT